MILSVAIFAEFNEKLVSEDQKKAHEGELDDIAKLDKEKITKATETAKKIADVEAEFNLIGLNEWDTKFKELDNKYRLLLLKKMVRMIKHVSVVESSKEKVKLSSCDFRIQCKEFYTHSSEITIFQCCSKIL